MNDNLKEISHCALSWIHDQQSNGRKINVSDEKKKNITSIHFIEESLICLFF